MYTIKNTSSKIINIDTGIPNKRFAIVMPDQTVQVTESAAHTPAVQALAKRKMLEVIAPVEEAPKHEATSEQAGNDETGTPDENGAEQGDTEMPKGTRRTAKTKNSEQ